MIDRDFTAEDAEDAEVQTGANGSFFCVLGVLGGKDRVCS